MSQRGPSNPLLKLPTPPLLMAGLLLLGGHERAEMRTLARYVDSVAGRLSVAMHGGGAAMHEALQGLHAEVASAMANTPPTPLGALLARHGIERRRLVTVIDGWNFYLARPRPRDDTQVRTFLRQAVVAPARMGLVILGATDPDPLAESLGEGIGRTRLLQHLAPGLRHGRVHFPEEELERFGVSAADLAEGRRTPRFHDLCWFAVERARGHLAQAAGRIEALPTPEARAFVRLMVTGHEGILRRIADSGYDLFGEARHEPGRLESARLALRARRPSSP